MKAAGFFSYEWVIPFSCFFPEYLEQTGSAQTDSHWWECLFGRGYPSHKPPHWHTDTHACAHAFTNLAFFLFSQFQQLRQSRTMTSTSLWCAVDTAQSHTSQRRPWARWWPLTSDRVWWAEGSPPTSKYWPQSRPHWLPRPLKPRAPSSRTCRRLRSPHTSPSSRRRQGATNPRAWIHPAALLPPQPRSRRLQTTWLSLRATAWRSAAAAPELRGPPKVRRDGPAVLHLWLSASNRNPRSWIRSTWTMVRTFWLASMVSSAFWG